MGTHASTCEGAGAGAGASAREGEDANVPGVANEDMSNVSCARNDVRAFMLKRVVALQASTKQFPTNGCLSGASEDDYYIMPPVSWPHGVVDSVIRRFRRSPAARENHVHGILG